MGETRAKSRSCDQYRYDIRDEDVSVQYCKQGYPNSKKSSRCINQLLALSNTMAVSHFLTLELFLRKFLCSLVSHSTHQACESHISGTSVSHWEKYEVTCSLSRKASF